MKKTAAAATLAAAIGFSALATTPAMAVPFKNCTEAREAGYTNIPSDSPFYGEHLDADNDGFGCDAGGTPTRGDSQQPGSDEQIVTEWPEVPAQPNEDAVTDGSVPTTAPQEDWNADQQVSQMPAGGADTGVAQESSNGAGALAMGGGLLAVAAGGAFMVRRRAQA
jgi:hypothetical protein